MAALLLGIDTAFGRCSAGLYDMDAGRMLARAEPETGKGHAEQLFGIIDAVLAEAGASYGSLGRLAVTVGPGSFTGLRVGVSAARGLALTLGIPAIGVTTLETLAAAYAASHDAVLSILDAKRGEVYAALYGRDAMLLNGPAALAPKELSEFIVPAARARSLALVGTGGAIAGSALPDRDVVLLSETAAVDIAVLCRLAAGRDAVEAPRPLYLRGADAKPAAAAGLFAMTGESAPQSP
ncbi:tRNA (adenosine(37)-N6)-threonylcarbamoyltransferase complex dimerization subunit type 1 TsaB [Aurantimonas sp. A2-1-M11]|uniref:tRNA (adenosine(37)-N6)-threonylcarbamoyltransferase complex dimerization subunit type 1 TsaB n=1 Tax=Aurantimonas sp. A2-1-M11 TaxID=3113712 RepID=UPI002F954F1F